MTTPQNEEAAAGTTSPPHTTLHRQALIVDGLQIANWSPEILRTMHAAGLTAVNCTSCVWEGFAGYVGYVDQEPVSTTAMI